MLRAPLTPEDKAEEEAFLNQPLRDSEDSEGQMPSSPAGLPRLLPAASLFSHHLPQALHAPSLQMPGPLRPQPAPEPDVSVDLGSEVRHLLPCPLEKDGLSQTFGL